MDFRPKLPAGSARPPEGLASRASPPPALMKRSSTAHRGRPPRIPGHRRHPPATDAPSHPMRPSQAMTETAWRPLAATLRLNLPPKAGRARAHPMHRHRNCADLLLLSPQPGSPITRFLLGHLECQRRFPRSLCLSSSSRVGARQRLVSVSFPLPGRDQIRQRGVSNILEFGDDLVELVELLLDFSPLG